MGRALLVVAFLLLGPLSLLALVSVSIHAYGSSFMGLRLRSCSERGRLCGTVTAPHRKLLRHTPGIKEPERFRGERCTKSDVLINQGPTVPLPSGIPTYTVEIMNVCVTGCDISGIHLTCGWFSSARLINPRIFRRLRYNDCLVNDGKPLGNGDTISFQYASTFLYPLSVSSVVCH